MNHTEESQIKSGKNGKSPSRDNSMSKWLKERGSIARGRNYKIFSRQGHREQGSSDRRSRNK